ncbi:hypothetical protein [Phytohabitans rumicis]|uniref:Uncharacterized protein n=1 Tax=Phytohabitans rumicis TaxID=1076125 RepID=A0A6V8L0P1_9ACTN|nr:hypothetical protein [Phytohabitans rumicis]GFJ87677.1 hypothetical protein Prum_013190 [Phytohabitans rumicis]
MTEVRASDFLGAGVYSPFTLMVGAQVLAGSPVSYPGDLDAPHSWTYTGDAARTLIAVARHEQSWARRGTCPPPLKRPRANSPRAWRRRRTRPTRN